jgi:hypothetical protein
MTSPGFGFCGEYVNVAIGGWLPGFGGGVTDPPIVSVTVIVFGLP